MKQLEAHEVPLHKVFCSDYDFRIPNYQRPYAWQPEQAEQLLSDLAEALDSSGDEPYFLGSIVLVKEPRDAAADVIDGQQRLTTLTILLAVLRDLAEDPGLQAELDAQIAEPGKMTLGLTAKPRLTLRSKDAGFFRTYVQTKGSIATLLELKTDKLKTDAQQALQANARALHLQLSTWSPERQLKLVQLLAARTFLVVVSTPDLESAHRIFSVMNARGLDLSPADIFKSLIIGDLDLATGDDCAAKWEDAEESLGRDDFADLFLHLRMIFAKERARRELLKEFPEQVLNRYFLPGKAQDFVNDVLVPYANAYEQIRDHSYSTPTGAEQVNAWFRRLAQIDNNDWRPSALWALRNHGQDAGWLDRFFRTLERLAASMFIRRIYTTPRVLRYAELLKELDGGYELDAPSFTLTGDERAATRERLAGPIYLDTRTRKYVLLRLDEVLANSSGAVYAYPLITVEHVLPQKPKTGSRWLDDFGEDERERWTHRLGNLVLLNRAKNSEAQNYDFATKKAKYFTSKLGTVNFALTAQVLNYETWTPEVLAKRQDYLLTALSTEWDL
ncbi:DUF262 domain-containing HNH endonuclease family protein [Streptomyces sp. RB6PN25]|uniref:DUF262 domain-containing HNH endonuclease family protein n=1 Tax=Streptomyces humicola TaxID=2953240 RepID=A0ABT1Q340_9ACTN|nr:DUF262 domain-containing protein [Streptomyces humicola]MCQ4084346.1 DUF262 domain-containing HNH endonuclease family protein [Streptomyces humicola]